MHPARIASFIAVASVLLAATHVYLYRRLVRDLLTGRAGRLAGGGLLLALAFSTLASRAFRSASGPLHAAAVLGWAWLGLSLYLVLAFLALDARKLFRRRPAPVSTERRLLLTAGAATVATAATGFGMFRAYAPAAISDVPVRLPRLPKALEGFTIVQLSDVHAGLSVERAWMEDLVHRVSALKPDLLVITGDLVDGSVRRLGPTIAPLATVPTRAGTYFVTGNHDYYSGANGWCLALQGMGITPLRNRTVSIGDAGASFDLVGVDDHARERPEDGTGYDLARALAGHHPDRAAVLLAHRPNDFDDAVDAGIGLMLSGHTHGGQTFPFTALAHLMWQRLAGLYEKGEARLYISRGVGFVGPPLRFGSPPEIVRVTLLA